MKILFLIIILTAVALMALLLVMALYRHKKSLAGEMLLAGKPGVANTNLNPEGTIIVEGEMWRARSHDDSSIPISTPVRVVGTSNHVLLVQGIDGPPP